MTLCLGTPYTSTKEATGKLRSRAAGTCALRSSNKHLHNLKQGKAVILIPSPSQADLDLTLDRNLAIIFLLAMVMLSVQVYYLICVHCPCGIFDNTKVMLVVK